MEAMALAIHLRTLITEVAIDIGINNPVGLGVPVLGLLGLVLVGLESASEWMLQPCKGSSRGGVSNEPVFTWMPARQRVQPTRMASILFVA